MSNDQGTEPRAVTIAASLGHTVEWDPPANILSSVRRWTCTRCGDAILDSGTVLYGMAFTDECPAATAVPA